MLRFGSVGSEIWVSKSENFDLQFARTTGPPGTPSVWADIGSIRISHQSSWDPRSLKASKAIYKAATLYCACIRRFALVLDKRLLSCTNFVEFSDCFGLLRSLFLDCFDCFVVADCRRLFSVVLSTCLTFALWILFDASSSIDCCAVSTSQAVGRCCLEHGRRLRRRSCCCCIFVWELLSIIRLRLKMMLCLCWHHCRYFANILLRQGRFLSRVSILLLTRDIDIVILSVRLSVRPSVTRWYCMKTAQHIVIVFSPYGSPVIPVLRASNIFTKFRRGHPLRGR